MKFKADLLLVQCKRALGLTEDDWRVAGWNQEPDFEGKIPKDHKFTHLKVRLMRAPLCEPDLLSTEEEERIDWDKKDAASERVLMMSHAEIDAFGPMWEIETGICHVCQADKRGEWNGWSAKEGNRYKTCTRCGGTGKAKEAAS